MERFILVKTTHSTYSIDTLLHTATRIPNPAIGDAAVLRRDGEPIHLLETPMIEVGKPMELLLAVREDGIKTIRTTTPVLEIL